MERSRWPNPLALGPPAALALAVALAGSSPARAAAKVAPGQELTYAGTADWKLTNPAGQTQSITGGLRFSALVYQADPAKGYSVILMRRFQPDAKPAQGEDQSEVELTTVQYGAD